jgi:hypothetical protein
MRGQDIKCPVCERGGEVNGKDEEQVKKKKDNHY